MSRLRQRVAERLVQSQSTAAILTTFNEVNMQPVMELRKKYQERFEKEHGVKLGFMSFFVKAAVHALKKYPVVNASVDGTDIVYHGYFDIGVAVGSPRGPGGADPARRRPAVLRRDREEDRRVRQEGAGRQALAGGPDRRHLLDLQRRRVRLDALHADHQPAAVGDPRRARDQGARGGGERADRGAADELPGDVLRPPHHRRPRSGAVPGGDQGSAGRPGAPRSSRYERPSTSWSSAAGRAATSPRSAPRSSASGRPASTSGRAPRASPRSAAPAPTSAASRPRRCWSPRRTSSGGRTTSPSTASRSRGSSSTSRRCSGARTRSSSRATTASSTCSRRTR